MNKDNMPIQNNFYPRNSLRSDFAIAMSQMYREEVPLYKDLLDVVETINTELINSNEIVEEGITDLSRINLERHGAIRLGSKEELNSISRLFNVLGMEPVGYYDLSIADLPVHSTVFRPVKRDDLKENPFRIFCSVLRPELLDSEIQERVKEVIASRSIVSEKCLSLIAKFEEEAGLNENDSKEFVKEALETFRWHKKAKISKGFYKELLSINSLLADIVAFKGPHINHLTPRVLDIDLLYKRMSEKGINMTATIQGPPRRKIPILLRQTSFRALNEEIFFPDLEGSELLGTHRARFGEIEKRGAALTPKGLGLYNELLNKVLIEVKQSDSNYLEKLTEFFEAFPDDIESLVKEALVYFSVVIDDDTANLKTKLEKIPQISQQINMIQDLLEKDSAYIFKPEFLEILLSLKFAGLINIELLTYEDFLPVSAAGIFKSNIVEGGYVKAKEGQEISSQEDLEKALAKKILDPFKDYEAESLASIKAGLEKISSLL